MVCTGDNEQFLVIASQLAVRCFAEIAGVRFLSVYQQHGRADLAAVLQDRHFISTKSSITRASFALCYKNIFLSIGNLLGIPFLNPTAIAS